MTRWRFALRSVRRDLARSILVIALIALPVAGATVADGIVRTTTDRDVDVDRAMGTADLLVAFDRRLPSIRMVPLPVGSRVVPVGAHYLDGSVRLAVGDRTVRTKLDVVAFGDPMTRHLSRLVSGRLPEGPGEVLVTRALAERLGLLDGENLRPGATIRTEAGLAVAVTGLSENPYYLRREAIVARQGSVIEKVMLDGSLTPLAYLIDLPDGADAAALARAWPIIEGSTVTTQESFEDKTPVSGYLLDAAGGPIALYSGLGLLGIMLTAGAAIAVRARRQVRDLGLVVANGGAAKHIRRIVLAQGLVLGVLGAASGLVLGAAVTVLGTPLWQRMTGQLMEDLRFGWGELAVAAGGGVLASVAAATVPAHVVALPTAYPEDGPGAGAIFLEPPLNCWNGSTRSAEVGIGTSALVALTTGRTPDAETRSALAEGKVVVFDDCLMSANGTVRIAFNVEKPVELPAYRAQREPGTEHYNGDYQFLPGAFISENAAVSLGWGTFADTVAVTYPASADVDAMHAAADDAGVNFFVAESASDRVTNLYLLLAGVAALVALLGAGMTVGLSAAEGRSDLATLAALGAQPRRRRTLAGAQALVVTAVGTVTGLLLGGCVGFAAVPVTGLAELAMPWQHLWLTAVGVPLLTTIVAMAATRSRLPMIVRRQS